MALTITLISLAGMAPAWGQSLAPLAPGEAAPLLLAQATPQQFNRMLFVNPLTGDDQQGEGSLRSPFRSITRALQFAEPDTAIFLSAGSYTERTGEQFPIVLPPGVSLMEDPAVERGSIAIAGAVTQGTAAATPRPTVRAAQPAPTPTAQATARGEGRSQRRPAADATPTDLPSVDVTATIPIPAQPPVSRRAAAAPVAASSEPVRRSPQAIPIPVPPPESRRAATPAPRQASTATPSRSSASIEIPVPPPENPMPSARRSRSATAPVATSPVPSLAFVTQPATTASSSYDLLPVPSPNVPLGYTGDLPRISMANLTQPASVSRAAGGTVSRGTGTLQYRVLVRAEDEDMRDWVQSVVPDAFETVADGETLIQIGAFQSLENAEEAAEQLSRSGIRAIIEEWR